MLRWHSLVVEVKKEFPSFRLVSKNESLFMKFMNLLLLLLTLGCMKHFMDGFVTTIGTTMYTHTRWDELTEGERLILLRHERVHMRQSRKYGPIAFGFLYLLAPLPLFCAYYRMKFEREAYEESLAAVKDYIPVWQSTLRTPWYREYTIAHFTSAEYGWMWPFKRGIEKWYDTTVARLIADYEAFQADDTPRY